MQERQFPPLDFETLTQAEQRAVRQMRARRARWLSASLGASLLALFAVGCPEPGDLQNPGAFPLPPSSGGSATAGSGTGGSTPAGCETACVAAIINATGTGCKTCHGKAIKLSGTLDFETEGYTQRLKDKPAEHAGVAAGSTCPTGDKLIDSATPANSWLLKKINDMTPGCGTVMPSSGPLSAADNACFTTYVNCVAGGT